MAGTPSTVREDLWQATGGRTRLPAFPVAVGQDDRMADLMLGYREGGTVRRALLAICQRGVLLAPATICPSIPKYLECFRSEYLPTHSFTLLLACFFLFINVDFVDMVSESKIV